MALNTPALAGGTFEDKAYIIRVVLLDDPYYVLVFREV